MTPRNAILNRVLCRTVCLGVMVCAQRASAQCLNEDFGDPARTSCSTAPYPGGSQHYTLVSDPDGPGPRTLTGNCIYNVCVNFYRVYCESSWDAHSAVSFTADPGSLIAIYPSTGPVGGNTIGHDQIWVISDNGCKMLLFEAFHPGTSYDPNYHWPPNTPFADIGRQLPNWDTLQPNGTGTIECIPKRVSLKVERDLQTPSNNDPNTTFRNSLITVRLVVTNTGVVDLSSIAPMATPVAIAEGQNDPPAAPFVELVSGPDPGSVAVAAGGSATMTYVFRAKQPGKVYFKGQVVDSSDAAVNATANSDAFTVAAVEIVKVEPVQVVYDVPLAARKPTKLRVTLRNPSTADISTKLRFTIRSLSSEQFVAGGPFVYTTDVFTVPGKILTGDAARDTAFFFPSEKKYIDTFFGSARLDSEIIYELGADVQMDPIQQDVDVRVVKPLKILLVPLTGLVNAPSDTVLMAFQQAIPAQVLRMYPVSAVKVHAGEGLTNVPPPGLKKLDKIRRLANDDVAVGIIPPDAEMEAGAGYGYAPGTYRAYYLAPQVNGRGAPMFGGVLNVSQNLHELGHAFGLPLSPVNCGGILSSAVEEYCLPSMPEQPASEGYDVTAGARIDAGRLNIMSSESTLAQLDRVWVGQDSYRRLVDQLSAASRDPECLLATGEITPGGVVTADPWYTYFSAEPDASQTSSSWVLDQLDATGGVLSRFGLAVVERFSTDASAPQMFDFIATIPKQAGVAKIQITGPRGVAFERAVTNAPVVTQIAPSDGATVQAGAATTVSWTASDPDGDALTCSAFFSADDGANWTPLAIDAAASPVNWSVPDTATRAARIKVLASDGLSTGEFMSRRFTISGASESTVVASAGADQEVVVGTPVQLDGAASRDTADLSTPMSFKWTIVGIPDGAALALSGETDPKPTFTPQVAGLYMFELVVTVDGVASAPDYVAVRADPAGATLTASPRNIVGGDDGPLDALLSASSANANDNAGGDVGAACGPCGATPVGVMLTLGILLTSPGARRWMKRAAGQPPRARR